MKKQAKITYELLRSDAMFAAELLDQKAAEELMDDQITPEERARLKTLTAMLKGATHFIIYDADKLPD